jgi:hypothetical protein
VLCVCYNLAPCTHGTQDAKELAEEPEHDTSRLAAVLTGPAYDEEMDLLRNLGYRYLRRQVSGVHTGSSLHVVH